MKITYYFNTDLDLITFFQEIIYLKQKMERIL